MNVEYLSLQHNIGYAFLVGTNVHQCYNLFVRAGFSLSTNEFLNIRSLNSRSKFHRTDVVSGNVMMTFEVQEGTIGSSGSVPSHKGGKLSANKVGN